MFDHTRQPAGSSSVKLTRFGGLGSKGLPCWIAVPDRRDATKPPLVAIHGLHRGAKVQAAALAPYAEAFGQTVIAPLFAQEDWPRYQQVVRGGRADLALLSLLSDLAMAGISGTKRFELSGYSGGAQFAHRFAMLYPHRVSRLTVIAAGWYTFPDDMPFPYGLAAPKARSAGWHLRDLHDLRAFLNLPIRVLVGARDDQVDKNTRSGTKIDAQQGRTRRERAARWVAATRDAAHRCGIEPDITLTELDGCGHDFRTCLAHPDAQRQLFERNEFLEVR
ncbi:MAG: hypothetical protein AAF293_01510 [Pseudomonadota bacterium]